MEFIANAGGGPISVGPSAAQSGSVRIANNTNISARNNANTTDISLIGTNTFDNVVLSPGGFQAVLGSGLSLNAKDVTADTSTGSKIGTAANEKLAFHNAAPVIQYATTGTATGFTSVGGTAVLHQSTFTGNNGATAYTIGDIVNALKLKGLMAA